MAGAEYALSHQWISVKDEMPRKYVDVFVLYKYGSVGVAYVDATETFSQNDVAFWMPIPPIGKKSQVLYEKDCLTEGRQRNDTESRSVSSPM